MRLGTVRGGGPWRGNDTKKQSSRDQFWEPFRAKIGKRQFAKATKNQCKLIIEVEAKGLQKRGQNVIGNQSFS